MQYLVIFSPEQEYGSEGAPADFLEIELQEQAQTRVLYGDGSLRQVWALQPKGSGAAVIFEANSPEHLESVIRSFPLIKVGYSGYQVFQLAPHPAFAATQ